MHPAVARASRFAPYSAVWLAIGSLLALVLAAQLDLAWLPSLLVALPLAALYAFVCLSSWYVVGGMPLAKTGPIRVGVTALTAAAIATAGWLVAARLWTAWLVARGWLPPLGGGTSALDALLSGFGLLIYLLSLAVSYLLVNVERTREIERRALEGQVLARESELRLLRAQIDPHFLFNSLHSISALTGSDPSAARRMCVMLADLLRESLRMGTRDRITLARELALAERYLALERIRYGGRLQGDVQADESAGSCAMPPLLLQPLVENAVTHGVAHLLDGGCVRVAAARHADRLRIVVENPCDPERPRRTGGGVGISNVRARLAAMYGNDAHVGVREDAGRWIVELAMPAADLPEGEKS
jgi:two-component system, LytTR family, sensor histidine kinase AlgZ